MKTTELMIIVLFWRQMGKWPETENQSRVDKHRLDAEAGFIKSSVSVSSCIYSM